MAPDSFFHTVNDLGAEGVNGTTDNDATSFFETVPAAALDAILWIEATAWHRPSSAGPTR